MITSFISGFNMRANGISYSYCHVEFHDASDEVEIHAHPVTTE